MVRKLRRGSAGGWLRRAPSTRFCRAGEDAYPTGSATVPGCWTWARHCSRRSETSLAEAKRSSGLLASSLPIRAASQAGMSGLISRIGRASVSVMRRRTPKLVSARNGGRPVAHGVEDAAEAEQVAAASTGVAAGLLGRHVVRRAGQVAGVREAGVVGRAGQAKVGEQRPLDALLQQDVRRLHVAVDEALGVGGGQAGGGLLADAQDFAHARAAPGDRAGPAAIRRRRTA